MTVIEGNVTTAVTYKVMKMKTLLTVTKFCAEEIFYLGTVSI